MSLQTSNRSWQDADLMKWLGREAPRYTSYPSAHHFETLEPDTYVRWLQSLSPAGSVGLYIHIPFCEQMCWFCGCNTQITRRYDPVATYVETLILEMALLRAALGCRPKAHGLHFGGGSPGILTPDSLSRIFEALHATFDLAGNAEISIELDPRRVTTEKAKAYQAAGFNRVSLGIQDTQPRVQEAIGRVQSLEQIELALSTLRDVGLTDVGLDIVYGLPHQTAQSMECTLRDVERLKPNRISAFSYAHVPWVKKHQTLIDAGALPNIGEKAAQYLQIDTHLRAGGFTAIGMDHFALPDDGLAKAAATGTLRRNFMGYTDQPNDRLIAMGASSISELDQGIAQNISKATSYESRINAGTLATTRGWAYRDDDLARRDVISDLMCRFEVDVGAVLLRHGLPVGHLDEALASLSELVAEGIVTADNRCVKFHAPFRMLVRSVACAFDRYAPGEDGKNRYSKVA